MDRQLWRAFCAPLFLCGAQAAHSSVIISEVFYDATGGDSEQVFVELYGAAGTSLDGWSLQGINGAGGSVYHTVTLSGVIPTDGVFVVADGSGGSTSVANADLITDADFQNGPDSIQLLQGATLMDALGYGDFASADFAGEGNAAPDVSAGDSLARLSLVDTNDNFAGFVAGTPTPGMVSAVPVPAALWLFGSGLMGMLAVARRRRLTT